LASLPMAALLVNGPKREQITNISKPVNSDVLRH
jgi:hypothetical protein